MLDLPRGAPPAGIRGPIFDSEGIDEALAPLGAWWLRRRQGQNAFARRPAYRSSAS